MAPALPILAFRDKIVSELSRAGALILSAPTGSGKSTQVPQFLMKGGAGRVLVLEPRRLSARSLAGRVCAETKTALGAEVGYQVRFESRCGPKTKVVFQTYGVFVSQMLREPSLAGVDAVVLDEFHERTLETDLALAWLKTLRRGRRPDLKLAVMSATLEEKALAAYLPGAAAVEVPGRLFPVKVSHHPLDQRRDPATGALGALQELARGGLDGSVLVFMPGQREIRRTLDALGPYCRANGLVLRSLHGGMELADQQGLLDASDERRVIVATNVAETGLTIPGVTAVIDSGLHRVAAHDPARGINTLYVARISRANAAQRAGRAGRTAPGRCVRLWSAAEESSMSPSLKPEIDRLELTGARLQAASLPESVDWPTPPPSASWEAAGAALFALGALDASGHASDRGRALLRYPAAPRVAAVLEAARVLGPEAYERAAAMAAVFETSADRRADRSADLAELSADLLDGGRDENSRETAEVFRQLKRLGEDAAASGSPAADGLVRAWLTAFPERLAAREGDGGFYRLQDGRGVVLNAGTKLPELMLALEVRERAGGGQARRVSATVFLPVALASVEAAFPGECVRATVSEFDARQGRVMKEERVVFRGLVLERKEETARGGDRRATADIWAEKYATGELRHPGRDEKVEQFLTRVALARKLYPDMGYPEMSADDWRLVYGEVCSGKNSAKDIERVELLPHLQAYLSRPLADFLERALPGTRRMPSGKSARFVYHETNPAELSARLGDFVGMTGTLALCEGRLPVVFDILAPNYRTVQKTRDLGSFWANAYLTVKKELKRRYPRHPWP